MGRLKEMVSENRSAFSNYNMVRIREAIRYFAPDKLKIFIKIPFFLHINSPEYPGYIDAKPFCHGIWNFKASGFFKEAKKTNIFPKSIIETIEMENPAILAVYHIGSLGTFTQSHGSDFDYWIIIDKRQFTKDRYDNLQTRLDAIVKYCRETHDQEVTFFVMDQRDVKNNCYAPFEGEETLTAPKIFLKEEFYRTFLMIAGKIPVWCVLPPPGDLSSNQALNTQGMTRQILSMHEDLMDLGQIETIPWEDILKGLLWHICKSSEDPVKAVIKATMIFSYGFSQKEKRQLLCDRIKKGYGDAGIDDYSADPYKALFDQILAFHEAEDPKGTSLMKNAIFFRLCSFPDVKMPDEKTPKRSLLTKYIRTWNLNRHQVEKLLSYSSWSESEKLLLEKSFIQRLAQMYNRAIQDTDRIRQTSEERNWKILTNKTKARLRNPTEKIPECSTFLKRSQIKALEIVETNGYYILNAIFDGGPDVTRLYTHADLLGALGWIAGNRLYNRQRSTLALSSHRLLFESVDTPIEADRLYMAFQPLKPLSDSVYEQNAFFVKLMILLVYQENVLVKAEFLAANTWGELFLESLAFPAEEKMSAICRKIAGHIKKKDPLGRMRFFIYQFGEQRDTEIVYLLKKAYNDLNTSRSEPGTHKKRPYLDML